MSFSLLPPSPQAASYWYPPPRRGRDVVQEIRWLGKDRICQVHIKENPVTLHLGEGKMNFAAIGQALREIGYSGGANLKMSFPPAARREALRRNQTYVRDLLGAAKRTGA